MKSWNDSWYVAGKNQVNLFHNDNLLYLKCVAEFKGMRLTMKQVYGSLVTLGHVKRIEELPNDAKVRLWNDAKEFSQDIELDNEEMFDFIKGLVALEYYLK